MKFRSKSLIHIKYLRVFVIYSLILFLLELISLIMAFITSHNCIWLAILSMPCCIISGWAYLYRIKEIHEKNANLVTELIQDWYSAMALMIPPVSMIVIPVSIFIYSIIEAAYGYILGWTRFLPAYYIYILILVIVEKPYRKIRKYVYRYIAPRKEKDDYIYIY